MGYGTVMTPPVVAQMLQLSPQPEINGRETSWYKLSVFWLQKMTWTCLKLGIIEVLYCVQQSKG